MSETYFVCEECGYTLTDSVEPGECPSCHAAPEAMRPYRRLADADADLGDRIAQPKVESRGPSASDLIARAKAGHV